MKIGVISDTHDDHQNVVRAFDEFKIRKCEMVIHCGDWTLPPTLELISELSQEMGLEVAGVFGNRDLVDELITSNELLPHRITLPQTNMLELEIEGKLYAIAHGHENNIMQDILKNENYCALFTGHSHKPAIVKHNNLTIINPGSIAFSVPASKNFVPTVAIFDTEKNEGKIVKLTAPKK